MSPQTLRVSLIGIFWHFPNIRGRYCPWCIDEGASVVPCLKSFSMMTLEGSAVHLESKLFTGRGNASQASDSRCLETYQ